LGCARTAAPDIGAIQFGACPGAAPLLTATQSTSSPAKGRVRARARIVSLRTVRLARRVRVIVRCSNATQLSAAVLVRGRVVSSAAHRGSSRAGFTFTLRAPRSGSVEIRVRATGAGGFTVRSVSVKALPR
jgi:hypothetical protein